MLAMVGTKAKTDPQVVHPMWLAYFVALFFSTAVFVVSGEAHIFNYDGVPKNAVARTIVAGRTSL
jgi:Ca2+/Na+ antiporter